MNANLLFVAWLAVVVTFCYESANAIEEKKNVRFRGNDVKETNPRDEKLGKSNDNGKRSLIDIEKLKQEWADNAEKKHKEVVTQENESRKRRVFLTYEHGNKLQAVHAMSLADKNQKLMNKPTLSVHHDFEDYNQVVITATEDEIYEILESSDVFIKVEEDPVRELIPFVPEDDDSFTDPRSQGAQNYTRRELVQQNPCGISQINARPVHKAGYKGKNVKVCVIDTGIAYDNPDFIKGHLTGTNGYSNQKGHIDWAKDGCSHGTHVAGTVAAADNGLGVVGVAPEARIHTIRLFDDNCGWNYASDVMNGAKECAAQGAKVIQMSLGGSGRSDQEDQVFQDLYNQGIVSVAAAGNSNTDALFYPASYDSVISVAAVGCDGVRASFSNYGHKITIAAPGRHILSTQHDGYGTKSGTSMACPHVSGLVALLLSAKPNLGPGQVRELICNTAQDRPPGGRNDWIGCGIINAASAIKTVTGITTLPTCSPDPPHWTESDPNYDCSDYETGGCDSEYAIIPGVDGKTAQQACCGCGGGKWSSDPGPPPPTPPPYQPPPPPTSPPPPGDGSCVDSPQDFHDSGGSEYKCSWYAANANTYCSAYGNSYHNQKFGGKTANQACCACGGGISSNTGDGSCSNTPSNFHDSGGVQYDCAWYGTNPSVYCSAYGNSYGNSKFGGKTANQACCACGGGNSNKGKGSCTDEPNGFYDNGGSQYHCGWYGTNADTYCSAYGNSYGNSKFGGKTANQACCACGGGNSGGGSCSDVPNGFHDNGGAQYNCAWYGTNPGVYCSAYGNSYANSKFSGKTANQACCVCGGGSQPSSVSEIQSSLSSAPSCNNDDTTLVRFSGIGHDHEKIKVKSCSFIGHSHMSDDLCRTIDEISNQEIWKVCPKQCPKLSGC